MNRNNLLLYLITDREAAGGRNLCECVKAALDGGVTMVQLREKNMEYEELKKEALEIKKLCNEYKVPFIINDNVRLALETDADGVHLGQSDMGIEEARRILGKNKIIGATAKTVEQAKAAMEQGADYLGSGAVFGSSTKLDAKPMDHALLQEICESVHIPVVAIGGITAENVIKLQGRGIAGVAVVSGIFACPDIEGGTRKLRRLVDQILNESGLPREKGKI